MNVGSLCIVCILFYLPNGRNVFFFVCNVLSMRQLHIISSPINTNRGIPFLYDETRRYVIRSTEVEYRLVCVNGVCLLFVVWGVFFWCGVCVMACVMCVCMV